ncbi:MAG: MoxR family ATPase [Firmicutes bacterium]|nr:MoxR family ATPase [Bacillota bacterium]
MNTGAEEKAQSLQQLTNRILQETEKIIVGKREEIRQVWMAILADGHVLLEDLPGSGKTTLVKTMSKAMGCDAGRIQFVPDLLPSDVTGMMIYNQKTGEFQLRKGPVMTNVLLADEINRAIPRTQSALLEAMEERQITIDGQTYGLPKPFLVLATQNPVEMESTFPLPAAQLDRFFIKLSLGYPKPEEEVAMLANLGDRVPFEQVEAATSPEEILKAQEQAQQVYLADHVAKYIVAVVSATRSHGDLAMGASPRGSRALYKAAKVWAAMEGRDFVTPDDVKGVALPVLSHRILLTPEARYGGRNADAILQEILEEVPVGADRQEILNEL